jgi:hypothetical protein
MVGKSAVMGMRERGGSAKAFVMNRTDTEAIQAKVRENVVPGSVVCTDEAAAYRGMSEFSHLQVNHSAKEYVNGMAHTNGMESVWAVLKRGYYGVYHNFSTKHLQRYVGEFSFRLNEGNCKVESIDRINSMIERIIGKRITYKVLICNA